MSLSRWGSCNIVGSRISNWIKNLWKSPVSSEWRFLLNNVPIQNRTSNYSTVKCDEKGHLHLFLSLEKNVNTPWESTAEAKQQHKQNDLQVGIIPSHVCLCVWLWTVFYWFAPSGPLTVKRIVCFSSKLLVKGPSTQTRISCTQTQKKMTPASVVEWLWKKNHFLFLGKAVLNHDRTVTEKNVDYRQRDVQSQRPLSSLRTFTHMNNAILHFCWPHLVMFVNLLRFGDVYLVVSPIRANRLYLPVTETLQTVN